MRVGLIDVDGLNIKPVPEYEDRYVISRNGDIWSIKRNIHCHGRILETNKPYKLSPSKDKRGYHIVNLYDGKSHKSKKIHNLVAITFIPNPENKRCVCHKDNDKSNNCVENLYWGTDEENVKQALKDGLFNTETPVEQIDSNGYVLNVFKSQADASRSLHISQQNISKCVNGIRNTAGGYRWQKLV